MENVTVIDKLNHVIESLKEKNEEDSLIKELIEIKEEVKGSILTKNVEIMHNIVDNSNLKDEINKYKNMAKKQMAIAITMTAEANRLREYAPEDKKFDFEALEKLEALEKMK